MEALLAAAVRLAVPLWIAALGELVVQRAGLVNVGIEGMMLAGAFTAFLVAEATGSVAWGSVAAPVAALPLALLYAVFSIRGHANQIVVGTALNLLALGATGLAARTLWAGAVPSGPTWEEVVVPGLASLPGLGPILFRHSPFAILALLLAVTVGIGLSQTRVGLRLRATGESARSADAEGVPVRRVRTAAIGIGAALAGLAGASLTLSQSNTFSEGMTAGRGFIALTLVIFGGWRSFRVSAAALFFGAVMALQFRLQARGYDVPYPVFLMLPYLLTLAVLALASARARAPADLGRPYDREQETG